MTWVAAGTSVAGLAASYFGGQKSPTTLQPNTYNMYGQTNTPNQGGITSMQNLFGQVNSPGFQNQVQNNTNQYTNALQSAASSPGLSAAYNYALGGVNGNNLSSKLVNNYAQQAYQGDVSQGANSAARTNAAMARGGVGFSTGNQQAQQADMAAAASKGSLARAGILSQNEQFERGMQQQDVGLLDQQIAQPSSYLSQLNNAMYSPLQQQAGLTTQLVGGNQVFDPTRMQNPSTSQQIAGGISTGNGLYSAYQNIMNNQKPPAGYVDPGDGSDD